MLLGFEFPRMDRHRARPSGESGFIDGKAHPLSDRFSKHMQSYLSAKVVGFSLVPTSMKRLLKFCNLGMVSYKMRTLSALTSILEASLCR